MKKVISMALSVALISSVLSGFGISVKADTVVFKHQNVQGIGNQTCYSGSDFDEVTINEIPNVIQGIRINQPVFRAEGLTASKSYTVKQELKDGTVIKEENVTSNASGVLEFNHARNCEMIEILDGSAVVASLGTEKEYTHGVMITYAPMSWQVYQRDETDKATITIKGVTETGSETVSVDIDGASENVTVNDKAFTYTKELSVGQYNITVKSGTDTVATYENVAVGDVWVAAGQSNMTDMGAITDNFDPETGDSINEDMHIIYAEDTTWHKMSHPAGEGRFFKTGTRTSPVTSFAREIAASENVPVGIVQSSVGGTYTYWWVNGIKNSDANSGYLFNALKSCFDKMPSHNVKGILWYQGCNDTDSDALAFNYQQNQGKVFAAMREFFGSDVPIITTQINDANQDTDFDRWSYVKDIQRQNPDLYDNVYVIGTSDLELGDTIHNSAKENLKVGARWANVAKNVVYGRTDVNYKQPTIASAKVTGDKEITLTFKNTNGLKAATGTKRLDISRSPVSIELGDLTKEFIVRKGASKLMTASNNSKGTELTVTNAEIINGGEGDEDFSITEVTDNGTKITGAKISQKNDGNTAAQLIIAQYQNGALKDVKTQSVTLNKGDNNIELNVDKINGAAVKAFLWDDITVSENKGMKPLAKPYPDSEQGSAKVVLTTEEELAGVVAVDCMYGKRFTPTLVDADTGESVLAFFNVIAEYENASEITPAKEIEATETATLDDYNKAASDSIMYVNNWSNKNVGYALMKFSLPNDVDLSTIASAKIAVYATEIVQDRTGNTTVSEIKNDNSWDKTSTYGNPDYADIKIKDIETINSNTAGLFPANNYSAIDISDYLRSYTGTSIGIGIGTSYASVLTLAGKNSEHPPKLIIQPGKKAELTYTCDNKPCANMEVTVEAVGATDYPTTKFTTDENGKITLYLTEGSYKATTEQEIGERNASSNTFTVSNSNVTKNYTIEKNTEEKPVVENPVYIFGSAYSLIKDFTTSSLSTTKIGDTGMKISTNSTNYNNVVVRDKSSANSGYYPLGTGLPENGYYLFLGSGGNSDVPVTLSFDNPIKAGKYVKITYAKPKATNNGPFRNEGNNDASISVGDEVINLKTNCEFDTWYTTTMKVGTDISKFDITLGKWSAIAISKIEVMESADTMEFAAADNTTEMYITSENRTLKYTATVYNSITTLMGSGDVIARGTADTTANVAYSVNGYENVSISETGLLTVTPEAAAGNVTVSAEYGSVKKSLPLELKAVGDANGVKIAGEEMVEKNGKLTLKAIPTVNGAAIPERATTWEFVGDAKGASITQEGVLTAGTTAGNITVKATLNVVDKQTTADVSDTFVVTVVDEAATSPYTINGVFLKNCDADLSTAKGVDGIAVDTDTVSTGYKAVVKAIDTNGITLAITSAALDSAEAGVTEVKTPIEFTNAAQIKAYIINSNNEIVSEEIYKTTKTLYKNVPLVADWITGKNSGLPMGELVTTTHGHVGVGVMSPTTVPYGIDAEVTDVSTEGVSYTYDNTTYPKPTADNALWYKKSAYTAGNNSIYARDGVDWEQKALPIGNGYMGAMLFGNPDKDQIQLNEETFWAAGYRGVQSKTSSALYVNPNMSEGINGYMSVGNLFVDMHMPEKASVKNYYRDLNLDDAIAHVQYEYDGTKYSREYFASYPKEVVAIRYTADKAGALTFDVNPVSMHPGDVTVNNGEITIVGKLKDSEPYDESGAAVWNQESDLEYCTKIKIIEDGGTVTDGYNTVNVKNANAVTILVATATDYDKDQFNPSDTSKTPYKSTLGVQAAINKATSRMNGAAEMTYDALKTEHLTDYHSQFNKVKFTLTDDNEVCETPTDELQSNYSKVVSTAADEKGVTRVKYNESDYNKLDKHLEELHFNYARYMMISSSRSNTMPATLQGKWCQSTAEIWGSCYCININLEMNYWFAGGANLTDSAKSLIYWFKSQIPAGTLTAKNYYSVTPKSYTFNPSTKEMTFTDSTADKDDVFIMHTKQAIMGTTDLTGSKDIQSAGNTAWLMYNLWDIYQTTGDTELLSTEIYPIMRKLANFYTQYLYTNEKITDGVDTTKYPDGYYYTTWEGYSPEHRKDTARKGIKYDLQLVAGMYDYTIAAAKTLGIDADKVAAWEEIRNHLEKPVEITDETADKQVIKEWADEVTYNTDANGNALGDPVHRHISHLVGLYPGTLITRDTPEELNAAKNVLINRGDDSTGWACSDRFLLWARTLEGDKALELFRYQLAKKTYSNLFDTHAPFQIDGNFGSAAGVMELLMQSQPLNQEQMNNQNAPIYILPALPAAWDKGEISGIKAKNGAEVSIKWAGGKATEIKITPAKDGDITIGYDKDNTLKLNGTDVTFTDGKYTIENAQKDTTYTFTAE